MVRERATIARNSQHNLKRCCFVSQQITRRCHRNHRNRIWHRLLDSQIRLPPSETSLERGNEWWKRWTCHQRPEYRLFSPVVEPKQRDIRPGHCPRQLPLPHPTDIWWNTYERRDSVTTALFNTPTSHLLLLDLLLLHSIDCRLLTRESNKIGIVLADENHISMFGQDQIGGRQRFKFNGNRYVWFHLNFIPQNNQIDHFGCFFPIAALRIFSIIKTYNSHPDYLSIDDSPRNESICNDSNWFSGNLRMSTWANLDSNERSFEPNQSEWPMTMAVRNCHEKHNLICECHVRCSLQWQIETFERYWMNREIHISHPIAVILCTYSMHCRHVPIVRFVIWNGSSGGIPFGHLVDGWHIPTITILFRVCRTHMNYIQHACANTQNVLVFVINLHVHR